jgi:4-amino-4-deoxy-L-arabinose transferase-like glycosyltransferase
MWTVNRLAIASAFTAGLAVVLTLGDPGVTTDEPLDVRPGRTYVASLRASGWKFFDRAEVDRVFRDNKEHPPLGRWLLGLASTMGQPFEMAWFGADPIGLYVLSGRVAPALAFALLVGLVTANAANRYGRGAGIVSGLALAFMPRLFAHAHLGALDTFLNLFWVLAFLQAERALRGPRPVAGMILAAPALALALLTKIHAWLLFPIIGTWALTQLPWRRAVAACVAWAVVGFGLFVAGWPWLWYDSFVRLRGYLATSVERSTIFTLYFGRVYADRDVPWHYPWLYFAVTVPVGLHLLGVLGALDGWRQRRVDAFPVLVLGSIAGFLTLFSTNVPVYDGERLFLVVFPLWALLIGRGFMAVWGRLADRVVARGALIAFVLAQGYGVIALHPFQLSYYNALVGGLPGAERLGLELTYWGDPVDRVLLDRLTDAAAPGDRAALVPSLYPGQGLVSTTRPMIRRSLILEDETSAAVADWVVVSRRSAYWKPEWIARLGEGRRVAVRARQGVWLSGLWQFPKRRAPAALPSPDHRSGER